ncbi:MAG: tetratricopeptide repeat protein [Verrucomicrobiota bacterium]
MPVTIEAYAVDAMKNIYTFKRTVIVLLALLSLTGLAAENVRILLDEGSFLQHAKGDYAEALSVYESAIETGHKDDALIIQAYVQAIECCLELERKERAVELFEALESRYGDSDAFAKERAEFAQLLDDSSRQINALLALSANDASNGSDRPTNFDVPLSKELGAKGWLAFGERRFEDAKSLFLQALEANVYYDDAWNGLGWASFNLQEFPQAKLAFERALEINPKNPGALNGVGWSMKRVGEFDKAITYWKRAIEIYPQTSAARRGLAETYYEIEEYDLAATHASVLLKENPGLEEMERIYELATEAGGKAEVAASISGFDYLDPVPWGDYEVCRYKLNNAVGQPAGDGLTFMRREDGEGGSNWNMQAFYIILPMYQSVYDAAIVDAESFIPRSGALKYFTSPLIEMDFEQKENQLVMHWQNPNQEQKKQLSCPLQGIASGQIFSYMRRLPQQTGFSVSVWLPSAVTPLAQGTFTVGEVEQIKVPAGEFACRQVTVEALTQGPVSIKQTAWIENGGSRRILKFDAGQWGMELSGSHDSPEATVKVFQKADLGIEVPVPEGWYPGTHNPVNNRTLDMSFLSPQMDVKATLLTVENSYDDPEAVFKRDYKILKKFFTDYKLRKGTKSIREINGNPAVSFIADYKDGNTDMVEYRCYYLGERTHWFVFRVGKDQLETYRAAIETMIEGFQGG